MEPPHLALLILRGPREGETFGYRPGTVVRIGRLVRGNTLPIKDAGISSKHVSIQIETGKWVIRDLDSSNGTIVNGSVIPPNTPVDLQHGDTIKIGEYTSIQVNLEAYEGSRLRRNPRRRATEKVGDDDQGPKGGKLKEDEKLEAKNSEVLVEPVGNDRKCRSRKGRVLKSEVGEELSKVQSIDENVDVGKESGNVVPQEKVVPNMRVTRNSKKKQCVTETSNSSPFNRPENSGLKCREEKIVEKKTRVGTRRRKLQEETSHCDRVVNLEDMGKEEQRSLGDYEEVVVQETKDGEADVNPGIEEGFDKDESGNICSVRETSSKREGENGHAQKENLNENEDWPDLEKLTLGEWFNFLEVHLPKQIIDATEEIVDSMKQKAERVLEYMVKQKNDKDKLPVG